ncbi:MAG: TIR domain-containing protein [Treponema sp.]|nr:TIR domain-containing protein [Treponema sp.]
MPQLKTYRLFISHSWNYPEAYETMVRFFNEHPLFRWINYSVPKDDPIHNAPNAKLLEEAIRRQMSPVNCVVVFGGVYSTYSKWINIEMKLAKQLGKPVVLVDPWGAKRVSTSAQDVADVEVGWRSTAVVNAIREYSI